MRKRLWMQLFQIQKCQGIVDETFYLSSLRTGFLIISLDLFEREYLENGGDPGSNPGGGMYTPWSFHGISGCF